MSARTSNGMRAGEDIPALEPEVLPAEGPQPFYDLAYQTGTSLKQNAVWAVGGFALGVLAAVFIMRGKMS